MSIGDLIMDNDLSYRPWEVSVAAIAALMKELSLNAEQIVLALPPVVNMRVVGRTRVQLERPIPRAKAQSPSQPVASEPEPQSSTPQLTDAQIEMWINDPSVPPKWREIRRFVDREYGHDWKGITTPTIMKAAENNPEFKRRVRPSPAAVTWNRALGRKRDRKRH